MAELASLTGARAGTPHRFALRVYWEDTDAGGIVYYANYLKYFERARSELVRAAGIDQAALLRGDGLMFAVRRCQLDYREPARLDDELAVTTAIVALAGARIDLDQAVWRDDRPLVTAAVRLACIERAGRPRRLPAAIRDRLSGRLAVNGEG